MYKRQVYEQLLPYCESCYITRIDACFEADTHMKDLDSDQDFVMTWPVSYTHLDVYKRQILERAVEPFEKSSVTDDVLVVCGRDFIPVCRQICGRFAKVTGLSLIHI